MNEKAEKLIRVMFEIYGKPDSWADALISDWEYCFNWCGISAEGDDQVEFFILHCLSFTRSGEPIRIDPPKVRSIGE